VSSKTFGVQNFRHGERFVTADGGNLKKLLAGLGSEGR
jgi:hypothetical protein